MARINALLVSSAESIKHLPATQSTMTLQSLIDMTIELGQDCDGLINKLVVLDERIKENK